MTAAPEAPAVDAGGDIFSEIGDALNEGMQIATGEQPQEAISDTPPGEGPTDPGPGQSAPPENPPGEGPSSYQLSEDGSSYLVPKGELPALTGMKTYAEQVQNFFPTANDAQVAHRESSDFRALLTDYLYKPESADGVLKFLAGEFANDPAYRVESQQAFSRLAERVPEVLKSINPDAYGKFVEGLTQSQITSAYARAAETGDPEDLLAAQRLDWGHTGQYKTELPKHDPQKAEQERVSAREQSINQREDGLLNRDWTHFNKSALDGPKWSQFNTELDKALAPVKDKYDPMVFDALRERISKTVRDEMQKDFEWSRNHNNERTALEAGYRQLWKSQQPADTLKPRIQAYQTDFMSRVRRLLPSVAAPLLNKATASAVANQQPKPQARPQSQPTRAANGQYQAPQQQTPGKQFYDVHSDPEFLNAFKLPQ